jgi:ferric-dicitrate binding protein FerR (iron transport regulator)
MRDKRMHLSHEEKARLIDGKVNDEERKIFLKHLAKCEECFEILTDSVNILEKINIPEQKLFFMVIFKRKKYLPLLALGIFIILLPFMWTTITTKFFTHKDILWKEILVERGQKENIILPDGTQVILDSGSYFKYPHDFKGKARKVLISGEGYFNVTKNESKPFIVIANQAEIKVLGTQFNVKAWQYINHVAIAVVEGKVSFGPKDEKQKEKVLVSKGQISILHNNGPPTKPRHTSIDKHLNWLDRNLIYENVPLREILGQLERWYNIDFILSEQIDASDLVTLHAPKKPIDEIIHLLAQICGLTFKIEDHKIFLYLKENNHNRRRAK